MSASSGDFKKLCSQLTSGEPDDERISAYEIEAQATSGDISVSLPDGTGWKFSLAATSGDIENAFTDDANGTKLMQIRATSGDITVRK